MGVWYPVIMNIVFRGGVVIYMIWSEMNFQGTVPANVYVQRSETQLLMFIIYSRMEKQNKSATGANVAREPGDGN